MDCLSPFINPISKYLIDPALLRINYLNAKKNVEDMMLELGYLIAMRQDVQQKILEAKCHGGMRRTNLVENWLSEVSNAETMAEQIKNTYFQRRCLACNEWSLRFYAIYSISKNAESHLEAMKVLVEKRRTFEALLAPAPPEIICEIPSPTNLIGLMPYLREIKNYLEDDKVNIVGIWGMGGVGKSTLLEKIINDLVPILHNDNQEILFDLVIKVVVSKEFSVAKLHKDMIKRMKLNLLEDADTQNNANIIFNYLKDKNFLILLDDVWRAIDLKDLGIPNPLDEVATNTYKRKVITTTRSKEVCMRMRANALKMDCLNFEHAWPLFKHIVGEETFLSNPMIEDLAKQVVQECHGLPLALNVIGGAMALKREPELWNYCLNSLRKSQVNNIIFDMEGSLFKVLKFSYDQLHNDTLRECFLSCSLWPEDWSIAKEELLYCWLGLGLIDDFIDMEEAYGRLHSFLIILQQSCLLEPTKDEKFVKMHSVMRDVALWIANGCGESKCRWIARSGVTSTNVLKEINKWSLAKRVSIMYSEIDDLPHGLPSCPNLSVLILNDNKIERISENYFQCLTSLTYLDLSYNYKMNSLPSSICSLFQLKYLNLSSTSLKSLPKEMGKLVKLEYLFLEKTEAAMSQGLLSKLQNLRVLNAFPYTTIDTTTVVKCLSKKLIALGIAVETMETFKELIELHVSITHLTIKNLKHVNCFPLPLELRYIRCLDFTSSSSLEELVVEGIEYPSLNTIELKSLTRLKRIDWKGMEPASCFRNLWRLEITDCKFKNVFWVLELPKLKFLVLLKCDEMERVIGEEEVNEFLKREGTSVDTAAFPSLEYLVLGELLILESICDHPLHFSSLKYVKIWDCPKLKRLPFHPEMATNNKEVEIHVKQSWWDSLEWKDEDTKVSMSNFFRARN